MWARIKRRAKRYGWEAVGHERVERIWSALVRRAES